MRDDKRPLLLNVFLTVVGLITLCVIINLVFDPYHLNAYLPVAKTLLVVNIVCTFIMVGVIWLIQIVNYPLFDHIGTESFAKYHNQHVWRVTLVVALPMFFEAVTASLMLWYPYPHVPPVLLIYGMVLIFVIWLSTLFLLVPQHDSLLKEYNDKAYVRINIFNWIRTIAWTMRGIICVNLLVVFI